ncbi:MAG: murein DD-endopeptidase MepM/ murein hydrolase activator NlpD [Oceanospirillaceae bacterium]|jgi:murein DD-endopeptidase MepM/ murein hydrolase activator NlpD
MTILPKLFLHFPKPYLPILLVLLLAMFAIGFWSGSNTTNTTNTAADTKANTSTSQPLDLSLKLQAASPQAPAQPPTTENIDKWTSVTVESGDSLSTLFQRIGLSAQDVYKVDKATNKSNSLRTLFPGDTLDFVITDGQLQKVRHIKNPLERTIITRQEAGHFKAESITREAQIDTHFVQGVINNSLFVDGQSAGLSQKKLMELANIFGWDIDFALDLREQDQFSLIYEEKFLDEKIIGEGNILAAQFINRGEVFNAIRHSDGNYYSPKGYSMRKAFLRSPVDFFRISSKYNPNRKHPVLKTSRPHRGVDYAAATGTPIKASGDGKVIWRGTKGGYGRTIILQHAGIYTTLYAHMSKYNSKVRKGSRVKQGQIIGYIGSSGLVTGPHLHYEFRSNGVHKNPLKVKFPNVQPLNKKQMVEFKPVASAILAQLESYRLGSPLASN